MAGNLNFSLLEGENMTDDSETCFDLWLDVNATSNRSSDIHMLNFSEKSNLKFSIPVYGYITPLLLLVTFFTNSVVVAVLSRPHMKSPSNFILCAMAITDLCTLGIPVPMFIYQYTLGTYQYMKNPNKNFTKK
jgi:flagellar biosynthesis protein FliP